ncbi:MAG TPA: SDR family NAD(P)-dependent oxidoreductase [Actinomycetota bacterium]|nr:SDR family NAD(P)-dependent oxidoreductase [Actinomycetota bacterium]
MKGKAAVVSGGASGLGRATAVALAQAGATVTIIDLPGTPGDEVGFGTRFVEADVTSAGLAEAMDAAAGETGGLDIAVSCAGIVTGGRIVNREGTPLPLEAFERVIQVNLVGTFNFLRLAAARMRGGVVVLTSSIAAFEGQVGQAAYAASKGGVAALALTAARDLAVAGIRVVAIAPGVFDTPMMGGMGAELVAATPYPKRLGRPEEFAALVVHIVENEMLNGAVIRLDGALRMPPR